MKEFVALSYCLLVSFFSCNENGSASNSAAADLIVIRFSGVSDKSLRPLVIAKNSLDTSFANSVVVVEIDGDSVSLLDYSFNIVVDSSSFSKIDSIFFNTQPKENNPVEYSIDYGSLILQAYQGRKEIHKMHVFGRENAINYFNRLAYSLRDIGAENSLVQYMEITICELQFEDYPCK